MNVKKAKMNRTYLKMMGDNLKTGDVRTGANFGQFGKNAKGEDVFYPPQTLVYPNDHSRRVYQNLKALYRQV